MWWIISESLIEEDDVLCRTPLVPVVVLCRILTAQLLTFECNILQKVPTTLNLTRVANLPQFKSEYRGNQLQEDGHFHVAFDNLVTSTCLYCFRFWLVGVVIIMILRASVLSADEKPEKKFCTRFHTVISSFEMSEFQVFRCFTGWRICRFKKCA